VFQHIEANAGVRVESSEIVEFGIEDATNEWAEIAAIRVALAETLNAFRFGVDGNDDVAIE
jgi:hypothetical protein